MATKARSLRKRKFTALELLDNAKDDFKVESEFEGPFWFEKSATRYIKNQKTHRGITRREHQLLREIVASDFYSPGRLENILVPLNDESSKVPRLRAYDWAVTNFSKGKPMLKVLNGVIIDPNLDYQNELRKHHRMLFDPFRRGTHLFYEINGETHRTTVGQLCFIKWCIDHRIDEYVEENREQIREHMSKSTRKNAATKRRRELTSAPKKMIRGAVFGSMKIR